MLNYYGVDQSNIYLEIGKGESFMKRFLFVSLILTVLISACAPSGLQSADVDESRLVTIFKLPT